MEAWKKKLLYGVYIPIICIVVIALISMVYQTINNHEATDAGLNKVKGADPVAEVQNSYRPGKDNEITVNSIQKNDISVNVNDIHTEEGNEVKPEVGVQVNAQDIAPMDKEDIDQQIVIPKENKTSEAVKILELFYTMLANEQYDMAYELLDDKFRLSAFKILGAIEISKSDFDRNTFSEFLTAIGIFKTIKIEQIIDEKTEDCMSRIYYYQSFNMENVENIAMPLVISIKKTDKEWKITALEDGDLSSSPFKE